MTNNIKNFLETNCSLLDTDPFEFCITSYNALTFIEQSLIFNSYLPEAGIDINKSREDALRFIVGMQLAEIVRKISLEIFVQRHLDGVLGYDGIDLQEFVLNNSGEWDNDIVVEGNDYYIYPIV